MPRQPSVYIAHGGGPMPLMGHEGHANLVKFLEKYEASLPETPSAIVLISAHWEEKEVTVEIGANPQLIYDYYGFPPEAYEIKYPAPGNPDLATKILSKLEENGIKAKGEKRGWDHGVFVPMKIMFPRADIPVVLVSLLSSLDPAEHIKLGKALRSLREDNMLVLGSGLSFHNMGAFFSGQQAMVNAAKSFDDYINHAVTELTGEEREAALNSWAKSQYGRTAHPREEHLLPLHVVVGAGSDDVKGRQIFTDPLLGLTVSMWEFD